MKGLINFPSMNRFLWALVTLTGATAVFASACYAWFSVPLAFHGNAESVRTIVAVEPSCTRYFQAIMILVFSVLAIVAICNRGWSKTLNMVACLMFVVTIAFPYVVTIHSPSLLADAIWLQMQHDNLIWLGGDINLCAENGHTFWGNKIYSNDIPRQIKTVSLAGTHWLELGLHQLGDLLCMIGYSDAFCQFAKRGWTLAVIGWAMIALVTTQVHGVVQQDRVGRSLAWIGTMSVLLVLLSWMQAFNASRAIDKASVHTRQREYSDALEELEMACIRLPMLRQDTYYVAQRGLLETRLGLKTQYTEVYDAIEKERLGHYEVGYESFVKLVESHDPAIARESLRAVLRYAIQDFNSGSLEKAVSGLETVLDRQPCNFKAIYLLQVGYLRQNRTRDVVAMSRWMDVATSYLSFNSRKIFRATTERCAAMAASQANQAHEVWVHSNSAKHP